MAKCFICDKPEEEVNLFEGITDLGIRKVCFRCSEREGLALIKKPTRDQLEQAEKRRSVREVMEHMSSPQKRIMVKDQIIAHKSLAKLKFPEIKQEHGDLVENYDWILKQARRRAKMTITNLANIAQVEQAQCEALESGRLFPNFQAVASALEEVLNIKILKIPKQELRIKQADPRKIEEKKKEKSILDSVKESMKKHFFLVKKAKEEGVDYYEGETETQYEEIDVDEIVRKKNEEKKRRYEELAMELDSDKFDFSKKENLDKLTLQDLAELKKLKKLKENLDSN